MKLSTPDHATAIGNRQSVSDRREGDGSCAAACTRNRGRGSERVQPTLVLRAWDADARTHASASIRGAPNADDAAR